MELVMKSERDGGTPSGGGFGRNRCLYTHGTTPLYYPVCNPMCRVQVYTALVLSLARGLFRFRTGGIWYAKLSFGSA